MDAPTYAELTETVRAQRQQIAGLNEAPSVVNEMLSVLTQKFAVLEAEDTTLRARVVELEAQMASNSKYSSKPPSTDGVAKPAPKSLRTQSGRKPGGQAGHRAKTLTQVGDPDVVVRHEPPACSRCGADLGQVRQASTEAKPECPQRLRFSERSGRHPG